MKKPSKDAFAIIGGAIAGAVAGKVIVKNIPLDNDIIKALIPIGAGLMLSGQKSALLKGVGYGMAASGGLTLIDALAPGIVSGPDLEEEIFLGGPDDDDEEFRSLNGPADQSILSGPADQSILSGPSDEDAIMQQAAESIGASFALEDDED